MQYLNLSSYPKLEQDNNYFDQKDFFINKLPYPLARSYFFMLNNNGQRRFSYFLELLDLSLRFYYFIFASYLKSEPLQNKMSLGELYFLIEKTINVNNKNLGNGKLSRLTENFQKNKKYFKKLIKLRNNTWGHSLVKTEFNYDRDYLLNLSCINQIVWPLAIFINNYFVVEEIIGFKQKGSLVRCLNFLSFSPFPKREINFIPHDNQNLNKGDVILIGDGLFLKLSKWHKFLNCETCHFDSLFIFKDSFSRKNKTTFVFDCINCRRRKIFNIEASSPLTRG